jgi:iron-sulfur cluster repair protein YtfE (RIC family)
MTLKQSLLANIPIEAFSFHNGTKEEFLTSVAMTDNQATLDSVEEVVLDFLDFAEVNTLGELQERYVRLDAIADIIYKYVDRDDITLDSLCNSKQKKVKRVHADGSTEWVCVKKIKKPHRKGKKRGAMSSSQKKKISMALQKRAKRDIK